MNTCLERLLPTIPFQIWVQPQEKKDPKPSEMRYFLGQSSFQMAKLVKRLCWREGGVLQVEKWFTMSNLGQYNKKKKKEVKLMICHKKRRNFQESMMFPSTAFCAVLQVWQLLDGLWMGANCALPQSWAELRARCRWQPTSESCWPPDLAAPHLALWFPALLSASPLIKHYHRLSVLWLPAPRGTG